MLIVFMIREGASVPAKMNWLDMGVYGLIAVGLGCVLAFVAAVAPAVRAAQMPPAAALATEV
jgi:ABC-type lipoprotein release transport system permease subunit